MSQINVIDSIVITQEYDKTKVLAEWVAVDPEIEVYSELTSAYAVKLFLNWSDQNGTIDLQTGDYFTFVIPDIFRQDNIKIINDVPIKNPLDEVVATYSIYENVDKKKEVKITFNDYVETHTDISGNFWILLFVGRVDSIEDKTIEFIVNGSLTASGEVTVNPEPPYNRIPHNEKFGKSVLVDIYNGYYIFNWIVRFNMEEDTANGFHTLEDFSFEDVIPADSPHVFLTDEIRQELRLSQDKFPLRVGEYIGADSYSPGDRYPFFHYQYNGTGDSLWFLNYEYLVDGYTTVGIDGADGLNVSNVVVTEKSISANLGRLTRPTGIQYCTIATVKISESALGDLEVVKLFENTFKASHGDDLHNSLEIHRFGSGGEARGIIGDYNFWIIKINENNVGLPGAMYSLYISDDLSAGADRFVFSDSNGLVAFNNLPTGTYYIQETVAPYSYIYNSTVYKVVLNSTGFDIYYGDNYEYKLSDDNKIINRSEFEDKTASVTLTGTKNLVGKTLSSGSFNFVVKNVAGALVSTGTNDANGSIKFDRIEFDSAGVYTFTVEETRSSYSAITYDVSKFNVIVTVKDDGSGKLIAEVAYPQGGIVFNNSYTEKPIKPCLCYAKSTKCRKTIEGQKIWVDNDNAGNTRPDSVEIILLRDGEVYKSMDVDSVGDGAFIFCCVPIGKGPGHKYDYQIDEVVPDGYSKTIEGYNVINTLNP